MMVHGERTTPDHTQIHIIIINYFDYKQKVNAHRIHI